VAKVKAKIPSTPPEARVEAGPDSPPEPAQGAKPDGHFELGLPASRTVRQ
jgi:hypothetical protein